MSVVYVACDPSLVSGGPELLHQLCYHLRMSVGLDSKMYYCGKFLESQVLNEYSCYNNPVAVDIIDQKNNILIVPEVYNLMCIFSKFSNIKKVIWFLSVDNYYLSRYKMSHFFVKRVMNKLSNICFKKKIFDIEIFSGLVKRINISNDHFVQSADLIMTNSYRGLDYLAECGYSAVYLSEYLNDAFLNDVSFDIPKKNIVVYNPRKGIDFTKQIIEKMHHVQFVPVQDMSRNDVIRLLSEAKLYIDFGNHPGKDRLPREAAMMGCCVITGKEGSAGNFRDVPIQDQFKFKNDEKSLPSIMQAIDDCLINYSFRVRDFEYYRSTIRAEKNIFISDLKSIASKYFC